MNAGATSGLLLNSPHTCKSLTQQMASRSSARVWEPIISSEAWGRLKLNCGGKWALKSCETIWKKAQRVAATARTHFFKDIWVEDIDGQNDLSLWDHVFLRFWLPPNGQTLLGVKHTGEKVFKGAIVELVIYEQVFNNPPVHLHTGHVCSWQTFSRLWGLVSLFVVCSRQAHKQYNLFTWGFCPDSIWAVMKKTHTPVFAALNQKVQSLDQRSHRRHGNAETQHWKSKKKKELTSYSH